jgi:hypothetical protein
MFFNILYSVLYTIMIYNVVLNSANKVAGDNVSNYAYYFNWSNVEEGEYEMSFRLTPGSGE